MVVVGHHRDLNSDDAYYDAFLLLFVVFPIALYVEDKNLLSSSLLSVFYFPIFVSFSRLFAVLFHFGHPSLNGGGGVGK